MIALNCHMKKDRKKEQVLTAGEGAVLRKIYATCAVQLTPEPKPPADQLPPLDFGKSFAEMISSARTADGNPLTENEKKEVTKSFGLAKKRQAYRSIVQQLAREDRYKDLQECRKCSQNDWFKRSTDKKEAARTVCVELRECFIKGVNALEENDLALKKKFDAYYDPKVEDVEFRHLHKVVHCQVADAVSSAQDKVPDEIKDSLVNAYRTCAEDLSHKSTQKGKAGPFQLEVLVDEYGTCSPCTLGESFKKLIQDMISGSSKKCNELATCFLAKVPKEKDKFSELKRNAKFDGKTGEEKLRMHVHCEFYERRYNDRQIQEEDKAIFKETFQGCMKKANDEALLKRCFPCNNRERLHNAMLRLVAAIRNGLDWIALLAGKQADGTQTLAATSECEAVWNTCFFRGIMQHRMRYDNPADVDKLSEEERLHYDAILKLDRLAETDDTEPLVQLAGELKCAVDNDEKINNLVKFEERLQLARVMQQCQTNTILTEMASLDTVNPNVLSNGGNEVVPDPDAKFSDVTGSVDSSKLPTAETLDPKAPPPYDPKHPRPLELDADKETAEERDGFRQITQCYTCNNAKWYQVTKHWAKLKRWYNFYGACGEMRKCFRDRIRKKEANIEAALSDKLDKYFKTDDSLDYLMRAINCPLSATGVTEAFKSNREKVNELMKKGFGKMWSYVYGIANKHWKKCIEIVMEKKPEIRFLTFLCEEENQVDFRTCMDTQGDRKDAVKVFFSKIVSKIMVWIRDKTFCLKFHAATARWKRDLEQHSNSAARQKRSPDRSPKMKTLIKITVVIVILGIIASFIVPGTLLLTGHMAYGAPAIGTAVKVGCAAGYWLTTSWTDSKGVSHPSTTYVCTKAIMHTLANTAECVAYAAKQTHDAGVVLEIFGSLAAAAGTWFYTHFIA